MICFHHNDLDGRCSAAIAIRKFGGRGAELSYQGKPDPQQTVPRGEKVFVVDFTVSRHAMEQLRARTDDITWIDHHISSLDLEYGPEVTQVVENGRSACELTWDHLFPGQPMPEAVKLTADKDVWRWEFGERTAAFNEGMRLYDQHPESDTWKRLLDDDRPLLEEIIASGTTCVAYQRAFSREYLESFGFETTFEGARCLVLGLQGFGSEVFGERFPDYDICITFEFNGSSWAVTLFSDHIDVCTIAEKYGGGGHCAAAGFTCDKLPF